MRWRPRFSLRTLVVFMLLATSGAGFSFACRREPWVRVLTFGATRDSAGGPDAESALPEGGASPAEKDTFRADSIGFTMRDTRIEVVYFPRVGDLRHAPDDFLFAYAVREFDATTGRELGSRSGKVRKSDLMSVWHDESGAADGRHLFTDCWSPSKFMVNIYGPPRGGPLAEIGPFLMTRDGESDPVAFSSTGTRLAVVEGGCLVHVFRRRRPEWWWGVFWLWEFWLTAAFAGAFAWSVWRDRKALRREAA